MKNEPLEGNLHYGIEDREFLDRNPIQPDLLPEKLNLLRWKLNQKAKQEPKYRFYVLYDRIYQMDVLATAWKLRRSNAETTDADGEVIFQTRLISRKRTRGSQNEADRSIFSPMRAFA
jgi:hypothetical protein